MDPNISCPHLALVLRVDKNNLLRKSEGRCRECNTKGKLWACLQGDCQFVGCGESELDHGTKHYKRSKHSITVNLTSFRIWCYACSCEVHMPSAFTSAQMKALKKARKQGMGSNTTIKTELPLHGAEQKTECMKPNSGNSDPYSYSTNMDPGTSDDVGIPAGLTGLRNMGNTCYMNSAIQAISNCSPLTSYFLNNDDYYNVDKKPSMAKSYGKLIRDMWNSGHRSCIAPTGVHTALRNINPAFRGYHQQDAQEFLRCLMDRLHEELKILIPKWRENMIERISPTQPGEESMDVDDQVENDVGADNGHTETSQADDISNNQEQASDRDSFYSESELRHNGRPSVPPISAAAMPPLHASYENISQLHGHETASQTGPQSMHGVSSWPQLKKGAQRTRTSRSQIDGSAASMKVSPKPKRPVHRYRSIISDIFDGELRSSVQCLTCDQVSHTRETFQDLSLPIPGKDDLARLHGTTGYYPASGSDVLPVVPGFNGPCNDSYIPVRWVNAAWSMWEWMKSWFWGPQVTLNDCLSAFFSADELKGDNMYSCGKCNKLRNGVKYCKLLQLPEVLCVHLKRFRHEYLMSYSSKISIPVSFPITGLDLRQFLAQDSPSACTNYDLCSVIVHLGNAGGGHYTTYAKNFMDRKWYEFDDQFVTEVSESVVANAEAYVLFYCKSSMEAKRACERITTLYQVESEKLNQNPGSSDLLQFYVSLRWLSKFVAFTEPGPIDNSDFVCRHLDVMPGCYDDLDQLATRVTERWWLAIHDRYGGGPAITNPKSCTICKDELDALEKRRALEKETFLKLNRVSHEVESSDDRVYISLEWFREWENFLHRKIPEPPSEIDNRTICFSKEGEHFLNKNSANAPISKKAWDFLSSVYGGGPVVKLRFRKVSSTSPSKCSSKAKKQKVAISTVQKPEVKEDTADPQKTVHSDADDKSEAQNETHPADNPDPLGTQEGAGVKKQENMDVDD